VSPPKADGSGANAIRIPPEIKRRVAIPFTLAKRSRILLCAMAIQFPTIGRVAYAQLLKPWVRGVRAGRPLQAFGRLFRDGKALLRHRLWPSEARILRHDLAAVRQRRSGLYLQWEHQEHVRAYRGAIAALGLHDKAAFARLCTSARLPHVPTAELGGEEAIDDAWRERQPLIVKPAVGSGAQGLASLERLAADQWRLRPFRGEPCEGPLDAMLTRHRDGARFVLQPLLHNHADLAALVGTSLATFRTVTAASENRQPKVLSLLAELPLDDALPMPRRWLVLPVDPASGKLATCDSRAIERIDDQQSRKRAGELSGQVLPGAASVAALACDAHAAVLRAAGADQPPPMIGWDLAFTTSGPLLIELNWNWAVLPHYRNGAGLDFSRSTDFARVAGSAHSTA